MKRNKLFTYILASMLVLGCITSCDDYLDVNTDPNNPTEVSADLILPVAQTYTATQLHGARRLNHLGMMFMYNWSESFGFSWYTDEFQYLVSTTYYTALFDDVYRDPLKQYHLLGQYGENHENYEAIGLIMKAYHFQHLVDLYGDVPYSEALLRSENPAPVYDDGETIYRGLITDLTAAIDLIEVASGNSLAVIPEGDDFMYGGDMEAWIRFANTLKIRILTRMSDMSSAQTFIADEIAVIETQGSGYIGANVAVAPAYEDSEGKQSPYWDTMGFAPGGAPELNYDATCATQYILDVLSGNNDPRISYLYEEPATGHLGVEQGLEVDDNFAPEFVSNIGPGILTGPTMSDIIFTLAEHNFNMAELAEKGLVSGDPQAFYETGITASFETLGLTAADAGAYFGQGLENVGWASSTNKIEAIITQKWFAVNGLTAEQSWFDYSRTGYPSGLPVSNMASTDDRPVRLYYPASELASNAANVPDQPDAFSGKIFWAN